MTTAKIFVGDRWSDGHGCNETFIIHIPEDVDVQRAYDLAVSSGLDDLEDYCNRYKDHNVPIRCIDKIFHRCTELSIFVDFNSDSELRRYAETMDRNDIYLSAEDNYWILPSEYFGLWVAMVNIGICLGREGRLGELVYEVKFSEEKEYSIGGYGLFQS